MQLTRACILSLDGGVHATHHDLVAVHHALPHAKLWVPFTVVNQQPVVQLDLSAVLCMEGDTVSPCAELLVG